MRNLLCALLLVFSATLFANDDDPSVKDHPAITRFPGTFITGGQHNDFGAYDYEVAEGKTRHVEGKFWQINYAVKTGAKVPGPLELARNYGNQFKKRGGSVLREQVDAGGGMAIMKMPTGSGDLWLMIEISNSGEMFSFTIVAESAMEQKVEFSADELGAALAASGRIALYGILFDTGKDVIKPESDRILTEIAALLNRDTGLKLRIEGHTDNVGKPADNLALSKKRADAVKRSLAGKGIADARLETAGLGDTKPVAANSNEEGRAKNRRVELVKR